LFNNKLIDWVIKHISKRLLEVKTPPYSAYHFQSWKLSMGIKGNIWELTGHVQNCMLAYNRELKGLDHPKIIPNPGGESKGLVQR